ncbi:WD40-repeat-containing domain protein [Limtongia smithiae]|uniref:WD40-repeat-containing domain protein n=1 Tax=Limtongia smithiae TaxID=1125753 RepID=UPI0034CEE6CD
MSLFLSNRSIISAAQSKVDAAAGEAPKDKEIAQSPEDSVSDICFSPQADYLAAASWDHRVRIYEVSKSGDSEGKALYEHQAPALSVHWSPDGTKVVSAGSDRAGRLFDLQTGQSSQIAAHDATIRSIRFVDVGNSSQPIVVTGSWDKTLKYWDLRAQTPALTVHLPERVYAMDAKKKLLIVGTADRKLSFVNLDHPDRISKTIESNLRRQTRVLAVHPNADAYMVGSIEGRCAYAYIDEQENKKSGITFRCHREPATTAPRAETNIYSVDAVDFHPTTNIFTTAGSDGAFNFWDKDARSRVKAYSGGGGSIPCTAFNKTGSIFAYAISYDWSMGHRFNKPDYPTTIKFHIIRDEDIKSSAGKKHTGQKR